MKSLLNSTANTRQILPGSYRFLRSDVPAALTGEDIGLLLEHNVRTVIDLRTEEEAAQRPCPLEGDGRFAYQRLPVTGGNAVPSCPEAVADSYIRMVDGQMERILEAILGAQTNVLCFCNAGKDRTGVVSAILQRAFGLPEESILQDYEVSGENLRDQLEAFAKARPEIDLEIITPRRAYMARFLAWYDTNPIIKNGGYHG